MLRTASKKVFERRKIIASKKEGRKLKAATKAEDYRVPHDTGLEKNDTHMKHDILSVSSPLLTADGAFVARFL
uniref:Uncharacterized protein n=1 Tax=Trichuris muris TaxID=70415 RepID=A0A5S6QNA8_TRIMR